jgi:hypothetical protein
VTVFWRLRENMRRFRHELWRQKNWLLHHNFFFARELTKNNMTVVPTYPIFLPVICINSTRRTNGHCLGTFKA